MGKFGSKLFLKQRFPIMTRKNRTVGLSLFQVVYGAHPRGIMELRELLGHDKVSGHANEFAQ